MSSVVGVTSHDTIFIRGFSSRQRVEEIRNFFAREGGRNSVEFFKEANDGGLVIALKFESKSVARDMISRFDDADVLGDRIKVVWYRDMRKFNNYQDSGKMRRGQINQPWAQDRNFDYRGNRNGPQFRGRVSSSTYFHGSRNWHGRTGPGRSSRDLGGNRQPHRRAVVRGTSRSRSRSNSSARSRTPSSSGDERDSRSKSDPSRKLRHSSSDGSHRKKSRKVLAKSKDKTQQDSDSNQSSGDEASPSPQLRRKDRKKKKSRTTSEDVDRSLENKEEIVSNNDVDASPIHSEGLVSPSFEQAPDDNATKTTRTVLRSTVQAAPVVNKLAGPRTPTEHQSSEVFADSDSAFSSRDALSVPSASASSIDPSANVTSSPQWKKLRDDIQHEDIFSEKDLAQTEKMRRVLMVQRQPNEDVLDAHTNNQQTVETTSDNDCSSTADGRQFKLPGALSGTASAKKRKSADDTKRHPEQSSASDRKISLSSTATASVAKKKPAVTESARSLPPEKMALVHEKKAEIEKAYKQDCETFATVTRMLISKDPGIEERIQMSLRENLKEIGQRCIQELRDFIEKLRSEQQEC